MRKCFLAFAMVMAFVGCTGQTPILEGAYQSEGFINGHVVQLTVDRREKTFVEYIDNRKVNSGTYEAEDGVYKLEGTAQDIEIKLKQDDSFEVVVNKLNDAKPILLKNVGKTPTYFSTEFDDIQEYEELLK